MSNASAEYSWLNSQLCLQATSSQRRAHPLSVLEALIKGAKEEAGIEAPLLWHWPGQTADRMHYQTGQALHLTLQLFTADTAAATRLHTALQQRLSPKHSAQRHFCLQTLTPWQNTTSQPLPGAKAWRLEFHTPLPLPKRGHTDRTAITADEFIFSCKKRISKLWGQDPLLPPPPRIEPIGWRYWRTTHRSRSQGGEPLFLNGCLGQLHLSGPHLDEWLPWLALLAEVGMGERLAFSLGRFGLLAEAPVQSAAPAATEAGEAGTEATSPRRPLYIERTGCKLSLDNENIILNSGLDTTGETSKTHYPLRLLESVQCLAPVQISTPLCLALAEHGIPLVLGQPGKAPLVFSSEQSEYQRNRKLAAHHSAHATLDDTCQARLAARWVQAKLSAQATLIRHRYRAGDNALLNTIEQALTALQHCPSADVARGWEGSVAKQYYPWLASQHTLFGQWQGRTQHGGIPDALNALLNYGYTLLRARVEIAIRAQGLDPYLGTLHAANGRHPALVSDFMEPLRAHVERLVLRLVGLGQIRPEHLDESASGICLSQSARKTFVETFAIRAKAPGENSLLKQLEAMARSYREAITQNSLADWRPSITFLETDTTEE